jgi:ABC-type Na+ efflux pump permease subunit
MKLGLSRRTWLVARREAIERSRSKAFKISTGFLLVAGPVMVMLGQVLPGLIEDDPA